MSVIYFVIGSFFLISANTACLHWLNTHESVYHELIFSALWFVDAICFILFGIGVRITVKH